MSKVIVLQDQESLLVEELLHRCQVVVLAGVQEHAAEWFLEGNTGEHLRCVELLRSHVEAVEELHLIPQGLSQHPLVGDCLLVEVGLRLRAFGWDVYVVVLLVELQLGSLLNY